MIIEKQEYDLTECVIHKQVRRKYKYSSVLKKSGVKWKSK